MMIKKSIVKAACLSLFFCSLLISCAQSADVDNSSTPETSSQAGSGENPITFNVTIPANSLYVNIQRREVTKNGSNYTQIEGKDWETIANRWIGTNAEDYVQAKTESFTDKYGVQNGKYYEYRLAIGQDGSSEQTYPSIGYHKASYNGAVHPDFTLNNYPKMKLDWGEDGVTLKYENHNQDLPLKCYNDETINRWIINLSYAWRWWPFFDKDTSSQTLKYNPDDGETGFSVLKNGNNHLTSFNLQISISEDDYFNYQFDYDVENDIDYEKIVESISGPVTSPTSEEKGINFTVTTPNSRVVQTHIYRKEDTEDDKKFEEVGFYDGYYYEKTFTDYYYEVNKTYDYQVRFTLDDWETYTFEWLGTVEVPENATGLEKLSFETEPQLEWDAETKTLTLKNDPTLKVLDEDYTWYFAHSYNSNNGGFFWPAFVFNKENNCNVKTQTMEDDWQIDSMSDTESENKLVELFLRVVEGDKIPCSTTLYQAEEINPFGGSFGTIPNWAIGTLSKIADNE